MTSTHDHVDVAPPAYGSDTANAATDTADQSRQTASIPIVREELSVEKQTVETGRVRVRKTVHERNQPFETPLYSDEVEVERVRVDQFVDSPPAVRREGDTLIVPLLEEVLVKKLVLREEIHIRHKQRELPQPQPQTLRYEEAHIERIADSGDAARSGPGDSHVDLQNKQLQDK